MYTTLLVSLVFAVAILNWKNHLRVLATLWGVAGLLAGGYMAFEIIHGAMKEPSPIRIPPKHIAEDRLVDF